MQEEAAVFCYVGCADSVANRHTWYLEDDNPYNKANTYIFEHCSFTIRGRKGDHECTPPRYTSITEKRTHMYINLKRMTHAGKVG